MKKFPKLRLALIIYSVFAVFSLYVFFDTRNGMDKFGTVILLYLSALLYAIGLIIAAFWDKSNYRTYLLCLILVGLPALLTCLDGVHFSRKNEIEPIELKDMPLKK